MVSLLADPAASRAVLIGVHSFEVLNPLPAVERNLVRLRELLTDADIWGLPNENCRVLHQPSSSPEVVDAIRHAAAAATDTLLIYYAGHGLVTPHHFDELHLALPQSSSDRLHDAVGFEWIRRNLLQAEAIRKIVILDCCYSARALSGAMAGHMQLADQAMIEGTFILTAAAETSAALAPLGEVFTAFTGELIKTLEDGIDGGPEHLDMNTLYSHLRRRLRAAGRPTPQQRNRNNAGSIAFARNRAYTSPLLMTVAESDPFDLGVQPALQFGVPDAAYPSALTTYVQRQHDEELTEFLSDPPDGTLALLIGEHSTGKTRAVYEAANQCFPDRLILRPANGIQLLDLVVEGAFTDRTVLWLDDAAAFLTGDTGEAVAWVLGRSLLRKLTSSTVIVGTIWTEQWLELLAAQPTHATEQLHMTQDLLRRHARIFEVPEGLHAPEGLLDPRLAAAAHIDHPANRVIQTLTGSAQLIKTYESPAGLAERYQRAVVTAAADIRRLGHLSPIPVTMLKLAAPAHLKPEDRRMLSPGWFDLALSGSSHSTYRPAPLQQPSAEGSSTPSAVCLHPYLYRHIHSRRAQASILEQTWDALASHAIDADDSIRIIEMASRASRPRHAILIALRLAEDTGDRRALSALDRLLADEPDSQQLSPWWQTKRPGEDIEALCRLADILEHYGSHKEATTWWQRAAAMGDITAAQRLADLLERTGRETEAEQWWQRAATTGDITAAQRLADLLERTGRETEAERWWIQAGSITDIATMVRVAKRLDAAGGAQESKRLWQQAAEAGDTEAMLRLAEVLREEGKTEAGEQWLLRAADAGDLQASRLLGTLLDSSNRSELAETWLRRAAAKGTADDVTGLADYLQRSGRDDEARLIRKNGVTNSGATREKKVISAKIVISGGSDAGKEAFIGSVSSITPLTTEAIMDVAGLEPAGQTFGKVTVALDFGRVLIDGDLVLYLFGTPGQTRFWFMWDELVRGAVGALILVTQNRLAEAFAPIDFFTHRKLPYSVVVTDAAATTDLASLQKHVRSVLTIPEDVPITTVDLSNREAIKQAIISLVEYVLTMREPWATPAN